MSAELFHRTGRLRKGYDRRQVEDFLDRAKQVWDAGGPPGGITSWHVRTVGFDMRRNGYRVPAVDSALDRIEDAFVSREERAGPASWREAEDAVLARLDRVDGARFPRGRFLGLGYRIRDVDDLCRRVREHLVLGRPLSVDEVRTSVFRAGRGSRGYREAPVDAYLDRVVDVMRRRGSA
ncbi:DivIVA domain-containing protein [Aquipuribacter sp. MA13-6]|uniref:DivIVA domain-containing protein n=1 Tax=unclassified Aquipuribacter TaxID=2635084 RepID=UPI003EED2D57